MLNFFSSPIVKPPLSGRISIGRKSLGDYSAVKSQSPVYSATRLPIKKSSPETPSDVENPKVKTPTADSVETPFKKLKSPIEKVSTPHLINRGQICLPIQSRIESQPSHSKIGTSSNLPASPLVSAAAPPLVNRSPFVNKLFPSIPPLSTSQSDKTTHQPNDDRSEIFGKMEGGMDEDVPPPPLHSLMHDVDQTDSSLDQSFSAHTSPGTFFMIFDSF